MGSLGMASPPPPSLCCTCHCGAPLFSLRAPSRSSVFAPERPSWMSHLADADFSKACVADRVCNTCSGAAFCEHCCAEHHRGHDTPAVGADDHAAAHRRDSFCTGCRVAFSSELCAHHAGHEVIPVVDYDRWYCARCTGSERWFRVFDGVQTFRDERGNVLVPLHWKPEAVPDAECRAWVAQLFAEDFSKACLTDRVCNTCGAAGFCEHCCGEHHRGHDTAAATNDTAAAAVHKRDSFCIGCRVAFCSDLCAHHHAVGGGGQSHEVIPIDHYDGWHFARCTGSERWFLAAFGGIKTFRDKRGNVLVPLKQKRTAFPQCPSWFSKVVTADYSKTCTRDRVCNSCGGAGFCEHCCGEHHRGHATAAATDDSAAATVHKRDSFCIDCRVAFAFDLCTHHAAGGDGEGHEVIPIVEFDMWYCGRCTGSEWWFFTAFLGSPTFEDEHGNLLVLLRQREMEMAYPEPGRMHGVKLQDGEECPSWMYLLLAVNFYKSCARDRVCNTCGGAAFCGHCCGEHHQGHDTAAATAKEKDVSTAPEGHRRDSFCIDCGVGFCSELCAHHAGHEVIPIDAYGDRHFVRSTGSESWFTPAAFGSIETFEDKDGNLMVPLERKMSMFPEPGLTYRYDTHHHGGATTPPRAPTAEPMLVC